MLPVDELQSDDEGNVSFSEAIQTRLMIETLDDYFWGGVKRSDRTVLMVTDAGAGCGCDTLDSCLQVTMYFWMQLTRLVTLIWMCFLGVGEGGGANDFFCYVVLYVYTCNSLCVWGCNSLDWSRMSVLGRKGQGVEVRGGGHMNYIIYGCHSPFICVLFVCFEGHLCFVCLF